MKRYFRSAVLCSVLTSFLGLLPHCARGDDFSPPPWMRRKPFTTVESWTFGSPPPGPLAPDGDVPVFTPPGGFSGGVTTQATGFDVINGGGAWVGNSPNARIDFEIDNWIDPYPIKYMWVQITVADKNDKPGIDRIGATDRTGPVQNSVPTVTQKHPAANPAKHIDDTKFDYYLATWVFTPNPDSEHFSITVPQNTRIEQVVVDTLSVPEPSTLAVFGTAACGMLFTVRRRVKRR